MRNLVTRFLACCMWLPLATSQEHPGGSPAEADDDEPIYLSDSGFVEDVDHMRDHLKNKIKFEPEKMSKNELGFHFFKLHDTDEDNMMDGLEILQALRHAYEHSPQLEKRLGHRSAQDIKRKSEAWLNWYSRHVDRILSMDDLNNDGYLSYNEFMNARRIGKFISIAGKERKDAEKEGNKS